MRGSFVSLSQILTVLSHTSRYLDNIFIIDNPALEKNIPDKYPTEIISNDTVQIKVITTPAKVSICDKDKCEVFGIVILLRISTIRVANIECRYTQ